MDGCFRAPLTARPRYADEVTVTRVAKHARARTTHEAGFGLIEVLVSALLVVLISLAVYAGLDAASATSGTNKHRGLAAAIAQQDQDRMRAMAVGELSNHRLTQTLPVNGVLYTVVSKADWTTDSSGTASCTGTDARANYLRISTNVSWNGMRVKPINIESIVAPPNGSFGPTEGSLAVQVNDRNGVGVPGVTATLSGARDYSDVTNASGCVLWGYLPVGSYTVTISRAGYIDPLGVATPSKPVTVVGQATTTLAFDYDAAATIVASFDTWNGTAWVPVTGGGAYFSSVSTTSSRTVHGTGTRVPSISATPLWPAASGYGVYAGDCAGSDPLAYGLPATTATVNPGAVTNVAVHEPPINLKVTSNGAGVVNTSVRLTATGSGCGAVLSTTTDSTGFIADRPQPIGTYTACNQFDEAGQTKRVSTSVSNTTLTGTPTLTLERNNAVLGTCP
jgi:Tfp pilus assembly protein PilV